MNAGLDGRPDGLRPTGLQSANTSRGWTATCRVNVGLMVGNCALRISRLGWDDVPADERPWPTCARMLADAMDAGALGVSSGLDYPPGAFATTDELAALTGEARAAAASTTPMCATRSAIATSIRSARRSRSAGAAAARVHITHFYHRQTHPGGPEPLLALVDDARAEGLDVTFDCTPTSGRRRGC